MKRVLVILSIVLFIGCNSENSMKPQNQGSNAASASSFKSSEQDSASSASPTYEERQSTYSSPPESDESEDEDKEKKEDETNAEYEDGTYCADVEYDNPRTGTESNYQLEVEVESGSITEIDFPQGWLDDTHFESGAELDNGEAEIESDKGTTYRVKITGTAPCVYNRIAVRCLGIDKDGTRCRKMTTDPTGYCPIHRYQYYQKIANSENKDAEKLDDDDDDSNQ